MAATKNKKNIQQQLAVATCSLLSTQANAAAVDNDWVFDSSFTSYQESDDRVSVEKFILNVNGNISEKDNVDLMVIFDTMTGATPTGAVQASTIVSVTGTSGSGGFTAAGQASALAPFDDTRLAVKFDLSRELSSLMKTTYGAAVSVENDYTSLGASFNFTKESASRLGTWATGVGFTHDEISGTGGQTPNPLSDVNDQELFDEGERDTIEIFGGYTRVVNARTLWQNNIFMTLSDGYHTDPYKVISIANDADVELTRIYEGRPDSRERVGFYSKFVHKLKNEHTIHASYRYYTDDWGIDSHTIDYTHRINIGEKQYIEPHVRFYQQTAADFFVRSLPLNTVLPEFASADSRLDDMTTTTLGIKFGKPVGDNGEIRARLEFISQEADQAVINENDAILLQISFKRGFY